MYIKQKLNCTFSPGVLALTDVGIISNQGNHLVVSIATNKRYEYNFVNEEWTFIDGISVKHITNNFELGIEFKRVYSNDVFSILCKDAYHNFTERELKKYICAHYRKRREAVCYPIINRGKLWYDSLTEARFDELQDWYHTWLDVTETLQEPDTPYWVNEKVARQEEIIL